MLSLLADAATPSLTSDPVTYLLGFGPLGLIVAAFMFGWIYPGSTVRRLEDQLEKKDEIIQTKDLQIGTLQASIAKDSLPALIKSTSILEGYPDLEKRLVGNFRELQEEVARVARKLDGTR